MRQGIALQRAWVDAATYVPAVNRPPRGGEGFAAGTHAYRSKGHRYKIYIPPGAPPSGAPLLVMLHGCTQDPDTFAASTRMNALARERGLYVLYPAQSRKANAMGCWNWFQSRHQARGHGEPAMLASMTKAIVERYGLDRKRIFIAGFSAGGAMAAILAAAFPDLFAGAAIHSSPTVASLRGADHGVPTITFKGGAHVWPRKPDPTEALVRFFLGVK
jgi:poly(hydroxyalkanoate) depolymerase family esterase